MNPGRRRVPLATLTVAALLGLALWFHIGFEPDAGSHRIAVAISAADGPGGRDGDGDGTADGSPAVRLHLGHGATAGQGEIDAFAWTWTPERWLSPTAAAGAATYSGPIGSVAHLEWTGGADDATIDISVDGEPLRTVDAPAGAAGVEEIEVEVSLPASAPLLAVLLVVWMVLPARRLVARIQGRRGSGRGLIGPAVLAATSAVVVMVGLPMESARTQTATIEIEALGPSPLGSAGDEVWVRITDPEGNDRPTSRFGDPRWVARPPFVVGQPGVPPLRGRFSVGPDDRLEFASVSHSGLARVTIDGSSRVIDTFAQPTSIVLGDVASGPERALSRLVDLLTVLALGAAALLIVLEVDDRRGRRPPPRPGPAPPWWLVPQLVWTTALVILWPGVMSPDSLSQWVQLRNGTLSNWHPYTTTVLMGLFRRAVDSPWLPILATVTAASSTLGGLARLAARRGCSPRVIWASLLVSSASPALLLLGVALWKDVIIGVAVLATVLVVWSMLDDPTWLTGAKRRPILAVAALAMVWLSRHNGWPIVVATLGLLAVTRPRLRRQAVGLGVVVASIALVVTGPLARLADVDPNPTGGIAALQRISAHVQAGTPLDEGDRRLLESLRSLDEPWPYDCGSVQPTWAGPDAIALDAYAGRESELAATAIQLTLRNPRVEAAHLVCSTRLIWQLDDQDSRTFLIESGGHEAFVDTIPTWFTTSPMEAHPSRRTAAGLVRGLLDLPAPFHRPALYLYPFAAAIAVATWRRRSLDPLLIASPAVFLVASIAPFVLVPDTRFLFGAMLTGAALTPMLLTATADRTAPLSWRPADEDPGPSADDPPLAWTLEDQQTESTMTVQLGESIPVHTAGSS